jgi:predicted RNase H-like HicB family nuclease
MHLTVETEREEDGRWIAEVADLSGVLAYGDTREKWLRFSVQVERLG